MGKQNLGKVALTPKGAYNSATTYERLDVVSYGGASYIVLKPVTGVTPADGEYYTLLSERGEKGDLGAQAEVVHTKGDSETAVMSQNAVTRELGKLSGDIVHEQNRPVIIKGADLFEVGTFSTDGRCEYDNSRIRLKSPIRVESGTVLSLHNDGLSYLIHELTGFNRQDKDNTQILCNSGWTRENYTVINDCYIMITISNNALYDCVIIAPEDFTGSIQISRNASYKLGEEFVRYKKDRELLDSIEKKHAKRLYLGDFIQASSLADGYGESTQRLSMVNTIALPYGPATKLIFQHSEEYVVGIRAGKLPTNLSSNKYWYKSGDVAEFTEGEQYYRLIYAKLLEDGSGYYDIDVNELETINPVVYYYHENMETPNVVNRNNENLDRYFSAKDTLSAASHGNKDTYPVLMHISDTHGDYLRAENAFEIADFLRADALCITGDIVSNRPIDGAKWLHDMISNHNVLPAICTGNHDVDDASYTDTMVYDYLFAPSADRLGNTTGTTYYYKDIADKAIRIIVTDVYQYGATTRSNTHMSSEQLVYIANALKTTPAGYGVVILAHTPCVDVAGLYNEEYGEFFQQLRMYGHTHYDITGAPIYDIVDAFIGRTAINKTYTQTGTPSSISVSADFSNVNSGVEFIAHLTGHIHEDTVCYLPTTHKQLMLNICCATAMTGGASYPYLSDDCDISKSPITKSQDAINAYIIDRENKSVKIVRIGGNTTYKMERREWMVIPYA